MYQRLPSSVEQALRPRNRWNCNITSVFKVVAGGGLGACVGVAVGSAIMATGYGILNDSEMSGLPDSIGTAALIGVVGGGILGGLEGLIISLFKGPLFTAELAHPSASTVCEAFAIAATTSLIPIIGGAVLKEPETSALTFAGFIGGLAVSTIGLNVRKCCCP